VVSGDLAAMIGSSPQARAYALYVVRESDGRPARGEFGRDMEEIVNRLRAPTETP